MSKSKKIFKDGNLYIEGQGFAGRLSSFTPPEIVEKMEDYEANGQPMPESVWMGRIEKIEASWVMKDHSIEINQLFGMVTGGETNVTYRGALQDDTGEIDAVKIILRGRITSDSTGELKAGEFNEPEFTMGSIHYYEKQVNGETVQKVDTHNDIIEINGTDLRAPIREAIGT